MLSKKELAKAERLYQMFWEEHPDQKNPSDINTKEKAYFLIDVGFENIRLMQKARKQKCGFTRRSN